MRKFVQNIVSFSLKNSLIVLLGTFLLLAGGIYSYMHTPIEAFPDVTNTRVRVITQWPGRSAEEIEKFCHITHFKGNECHPEQNFGAFNFLVWTICGDGYF